MVEKKPEYIDSEKLQWIAKKIGNVMELVIEPKVGIVVEDYNRKLSKQEALANGNDTEKPTLSVTFSGKKSTDSAARARELIKKQNILKDACISLHQDSPARKIDFDLERLSKIEERDFDNITKAVAEETFRNKEKTIGERHKKDVEEFESDLLLKRISPIISLMVADLNLHEQSGVFRNGKTLSVMVSGKDGASAVKTIKRLINNTPMQDAYIKPTFEELIRNTSVLQDCMFNPEHKIGIMLKDKDPLYEVKFDLNKLAAVPKEKFDDMLRSTQARIRAKAYLSFDSSGLGRSI